MQVLFTVMHAVLWRAVLQALQLNVYEKELENGTERKDLWQRLSINAPAAGVNWFLTLRHSAISVNIV